MNQTITNSHLVTAQDYKDLVNRYRSPEAIYVEEGMGWATIHIHRSRRERWFTRKKNYAEEIEKEIKRRKPIATNVEVIVH